MACRIKLAYGRPALTGRPAEPCDRLTHMPDCRNLFGAPKQTTDIGHDPLAGSDRLRTAFCGACGPLREVQNEDQVFDRGSRRIAAWPCAAPGDGRRQDHRGVLEDFPGGALE